jgi:hypothetical protein
MTKAVHDYATPAEEAGDQAMQLGRVLALVGELAGRAPADTGSLSGLAALYDRSPPIAQRRFDEAAAATARWAEAGLEALLALSERGRPVGPAAERLAHELDRAIRRLAQIPR